MPTFAVDASNPNRSSVKADASDPADDVCDRGQRGDGDTNRLGRGVTSFIYVQGPPLEMQDQIDSLTDTQYFDVNYAGRANAAVL